MKKSFCILVAVLFLLIAVTSAWAAPVDKEIKFTKKTTLIYPKTYTMRFSLWNDATAGTEVWSEEKTIKLTTSSTIKTNLGDANPLDPADFSQQLWVQVEKLKADGITYVPVGERDKLVASPYAIGYEIGADFADGDQTINLDSVDTIIRSTTISAPSSGVVIVNAGGYIQFTSAGDDLIRCSITTDSGLDFNHLINMSDGGADNNYTALSGTRGFTVSAGDITFNLVCSMYTGTATLRDSNVTAIFVPSRY